MLLLKVRSIGELASMGRTFCFITLQPQAEHADRTLLALVERGVYTYVPGSRKATLFHDATGCRVVNKVATGKRGD